MSKTYETISGKTVSVMDTWRKHGFVPPSDVKLKHRSMRDEIALQLSKKIARERGQNNALPSL